MKIDITFSVLSFNQENTVLESLESVKHQVAHYGSGNTAQLLIVDDASEDHTYLLEQEWAKLNKSYFAKIDILPSNQHRGINQNLLRSLDYIEGDYSKGIAGDDLVADVDIFSLIRERDADIYILGYFSFNDSKIGTFQDDNYLYWNYSFKDLQRISRWELVPISVLRLVISRKLFDSGYRKALSRYMYIEDVPAWEYLMSGEEKRIQYVNAPLTLYRKSGQNISIVGTSNPYYKQFKLDQNKLYMDRAKNAEGALEHYVALMNQKRQAGGSFFYGVINPYRYYHKFQMWKNKEKIQKLVHELEQNHKERNLMYLQDIQARAREMYANIMHV